MDNVVVQNLDLVVNEIEKVQNIMTYNAILATALVISIFVLYIINKLLNGMQIRL